MNRGDEAISKVDARLLRFARNDLEFQVCIFIFDMGGQA